MMIPSVHPKCHRLSIIMLCFFVSETMKTNRMCEDHAATVIITPISYNLFTAVIPSIDSMDWPTHYCHHNNYSIAT